MDGYFLMTYCALSDFVAKAFATRIPLRDHTLRASTKDTKSHKEKLKDLIGFLTQTIGGSAIKEIYSQSGFRRRRNNG